MSTGSSLLSLSASGLAPLPKRWLARPYISKGSQAVFRASQGAVPEGAGSSREMRGRGTVAPVPSPGVVDAVVEGLGTPERVGVVKLEQVHPLAWVEVAARVDLLVTVAAIHGNHHTQRGLPLPVGVAGIRAPLHVPTLASPFCICHPQRAT